MHSKIVPKKGSKATPPSSVIEYLEHEKNEKIKEKGEEEKGIFFNKNEDEIDAEIVGKTIEKNAKGLRKNQEKFYSLIISPSKNELQHIENNTEKLKAFTRKVMRNYAENFRLSKGERLDENDVVWFATIHTYRKIKKNDIKKTGDDIYTRKELEQVKQIRNKLEEDNFITVGKRSELQERLSKITDRAEKRNLKRMDANLVKIGEKKPGANLHVHIIVSARDREMQHRLNPKGRKSTFFMKKWQINNFESFKKMFGYDKGWEGEKLKDNSLKDKEKQLIKEKISFINDKFYCSEKSIREKIDPTKVEKIAEGHKYDKNSFFYNLKKLTSEFKKGKYIDDPYQFLQNSKETEEKDHSVKHQKNKYNIEDFSRVLEDKKATTTEKHEGGLTKELGARVKELEEFIQSKNNNKDQAIENQKDRGEEYER